MASIWACLVGGSTLALATLATDQAILQRLFTAKSIADCKRAVLLQGLLNLPISLLLYFVGTALFAPE